MLHYFNPDLGLLFLRLALGICLLMHGAAKVRHGVGAVKSMITPLGIPAFAAYGAYLGEVVAPVMLILGILTPLAAFVILGNTLTILFVAYRSSLFKRDAFGGFVAEIPYLYVGMALAFMVMGGGSYALL